MIHHLASLKMLEINSSLVGLPLEFFKKLTCASGNIVAVDHFGGVLTSFMLYKR